MKSTEWKVIRAATEAEIPDTGFEIDDNTAIVIVDPQNDFLTEEGVAWGVVGESVVKNNTVDNLDTLFREGIDANVPIFISPHYYYPSDHGWKFEGALEKLMHVIKMFDREDPLSLKDFEGSGADWVEQFKKYINTDHVTVCSPHKVFGPEPTDLILQMRKQKVDKVLLAGMSSNLCVESHMRELLEQGFEVAVVADATGSAIVPGIDSFEAALINFRLIASHVYSTEEAAEELQAYANSKAVTA